MTKTISFHDLSKMTREQRDRLLKRTEANNIWISKGCCISNLTVFSDIFE